MVSPGSKLAPWSRTEIVDLKGLVSSYPQDAPYNERKDISKLTHTNWATADCAVALRSAQGLVEQEGGQLSITEAGRWFSTSAKARNAYLKGEKHAYVAPPGGSMHNGGQAVDWWVYKLNFKGIPRDKWLEHLWEIVIPQGFTPIIKIPSLKQSECWHFDFRGPWQDTYNWFKKWYPSKAYSMMARCAILDAGAWDFTNDIEHNGKWMRIAYLQAQLHRIGIHGVGVVDGIFGSKTRNALKMVSGVPFFMHDHNFDGEAYLLNRTHTGQYLEHEGKNNHE